MAFDFPTVFGTVRDNLKAVTDTNGHKVFADVFIGEPNGAVPSQSSAYLRVASAEVVDTTLTTAVEQHIVEITIYRGRYTGGAESSELSADDIVTRVMDKVYGDFTLGGGVRLVDVGGIYGQTLAVSFETTDFDQVPYHVATITLPLVVDSTTAFVA